MPRYHRDLTFQQFAEENPWVAEIALNEHDAAGSTAQSFLVGQWVSWDGDNDNLPPHRDFVTRVAFPKQEEGQ